ncbi:DUF2332 family protein [Curtobacterium sp. MCBD17_019]|uniref:DUF2332 family protein n=1 Tax=Curtobacterium sp. MCBD17_019 TaxID=2175669 RepID=UPI000DA774D8|nr:DUF2332 family protein [Curtobacterium sp. MCBD17_019]PZE74729.1 hypothetical protein DEI82_09905 [Curtobacterium sp. MCBD17_019]
MLSADAPGRAEPPHQPEPDGPEATRRRYRHHAERMVTASPTSARWATSIAEDDAAVDLLIRVAPTKRQPELLFAVARRLGADPTDREALLRLVRDAPDRLLAELAVSTTQTNDPRRMAPVVPVLAGIPGPLALLEVGVSAGLCIVPDHATVDVDRLDDTVRVAEAAREPEIPLRFQMRPGPAAPSDGRRGAGRSRASRPSTDDAGSRADGTGPRRPSRLDVVARFGLDPAPIDLRSPGAFDRLVESVPVEATDRVALMRRAADAVRADPYTAVRGTAPDDLDRAIDLLPRGATPVVLTLGTLVYLPGSDRQRVVERLRDRGVRWVAMERTGSLHDVAATLPPVGELAERGIDLAAPSAFATVSLDGVALALADAHGTTVTPLGADPSWTLGTPTA